MKISKKWLLDYVDASGLSDEDISRILTDVGLEVEGMERSQAVTEKVVVGKIVSARPHEESDHLRVCEVNVGSEVLQIVCGAPNAREGIYVCVATVGALLPGDFKIKASKIRGVKSFGMMCSETELGIGTDDAGIIELETKVAGIDESYLGRPVADVLGLSDTVFELNVTPNRSDCLGHVGVGRELAAQLKKTVTLPKVSEEIFCSEDSSNKIKIEVRNEPDTTLSSVFCGMYIEGISNCQSPKWMKERLESAGVRSINLMVDITNFVMLEYSQPIHAYDCDSIEDNTLIVRRAGEGEKLQTLDGKDHLLTTQDIVIADTKKVVGLAGVMGGACSEIKDTTSNVIIEVAHFNPSLIRKTAKRYGFHTEASHRFERGVDATNALTVTQRIAYLVGTAFKEMGEAAPKIYKIMKVGGESHEPTKIAVRLDRVKTLLGYRSVSQEQVNECLKWLGFKLLDQTSGRSLFEVPSWRNDCFKEVDLIEEVARSVGFDKIEARLPVVEIGSSRENPFVSFVEKIRTSIASLGFLEAISFPFVSRKDIENLQVSVGQGGLLDSLVELKNPLVEEERFMQTSLVINLLKVCEKNRRVKNSQLAFFECSKIYLNQNISLDSELNSSFKFLKAPSLLLNKREKTEVRVKEYNTLAAIIDQPLEEKGWNHPEVRADFFYIKSKVEELFSSFGISICFKKDLIDKFPFLNPGSSVSIWVENEFVGYCGVIHPQVALNYDLGVKDTPVVFELYLDPIYTYSQKQKRTIDCTWNKYPGVTRDLAIVVDKAISFSDIVEALSKIPRRNLINYRLFDVYNINDTQKSMALNFFFRSSKRTLNDIEVDKEIGAILEGLGKNIGATLRQ